MASEHRRLLLHRFLSLDLCKELEFIHRSCATVGYKPNLFSTTLWHLIATNSPHLILPFVSLRERIKEKVEDFFGCEFELFIEFTGLISWCKGAYIGWHSDDNRPYLKQRDFAAVCYLNSHGKDFKGGVFHFKDGEPSAVVPVAGDVLIYTADSCNIHSVDEVLDGERLTLTLWFTRDSSYDEDAKLISLLSRRLSSYDNEIPCSYLPCPASDNMYWFSNDQVGFDVRWARAHILGFNFYSSCSQQGILSDSSDEPLELLVKQLRLGRGDVIFDEEFANSLHALQVVQFYYWKASELAAEKRETGTNMRASQHSVHKKLRELELDLSCDRQLAESVLGCMSYDGAEISFDWDDFSLAVVKYEEYISSLHKNLLIHLGHWVFHQTISFVTSSEVEERKLIPK